MPDSIISPRGIPPIRTDWLADVAWRTALIGPDVLGSLTEDDAIALTDVVDGQTWRIEAFRVSEEVASWAELDADLYLPTDGDTATMRVGLALVPVWDDVRQEKALDVRIEVGPRGAVTFDPENWMLRIPSGASERPAIDGVTAGEWQRVPVPRHEAVALDTLAGRRVGFGEVTEIAEGGTTWIASLPVYAAAPKQGFFAKLRGEVPLGDPEAVIVIEADGPLTADPAELLAGEDFPEIGVIDGVELVDGVVRIVGEQLEAAGGWIGVSGPAVRVSARAA